MRFEVAAVKRAEKPSKYNTDPKKQLEFLAHSPVEAWSKPEKPLISSGSTNQFVSAVEMSFATHYPLILSPDALWITLTQGLAQHIDKNAEKVRKRFVSHEGKVKIEIQRDYFVKGSPDNDWPGAFTEFSARIKSHIGETNHKGIVADFSTTGPIEQAASEVVLMDAMKNYFEYGVMTCCGIPEITLLGKVEDWESLRDKINAWEGLDLDWWTQHLKTVLDQFVNAAKGQVDTGWWNSFYKENGGMMSGESTKVSGWINWLFPYLSAGHRNTKVGVSGLTRGDGLLESAYPSSLSKVPFTWNYYGQEFKYEFLAGITGVTQDPATLAVSPVAGWGIREENAQFARREMF